MIFQNLGCRREGSSRPPNSRKGEGPKGVGATAMLGKEAQATPGPILRKQEGVAMGTQSKAPIGSRWKDAQGRVWKVIERKPFGRIDLLREDRAVFCDTRLSDLLKTHTHIN